MTISEIHVTMEDIDKYPWQAVISESDARDCSAYTDLLYGKAKVAESTADFAGQQVYELLGGVASLLPRSDPWARESDAEPFGPMMEIQGRRSPIVADFTDAHLECFKQLAVSVADAEMRARFADVVWIAKHDHEMGALAVTAYLESAQSLQAGDTWYTGCQRIARGFSLSVSLGRADLVTDVVSHIGNILANYDDEDTSLFAAGLMQILLQHGYGDPGAHAQLAQHLATRAATYRDWHTCRIYWEIAARWHGVSKQTAARHAALEEVGETYARKAQEALERVPPSHMIAARNLHCAIEALQRIPGTKARREELHQLLRDYEQKALGEMHVLTGEIDVSPLVEQACLRVSGNPIGQALLALASLGRPQSVSDLQRRAEHVIHSSPLLHSVSRTIVDDEGAVIARRASPFSHDPKEVEAARKEEMFELAVQGQQLHAKAIVEPARHQINAEHAVSVRDFLSIVSNSPLVPPGHELILARGLDAGMKGDFVVAAHLLSPQLESMVRHLLKQRGVRVSGIKPQGIEGVHFLHHLLSIPETAEALGEDMVFDLRGLLIEPCGSNLRNLMSHGLVVYDALFSYQVVYLWWLVLHLCSLIPIRAARGEPEKAPEENEKMSVSSRAQGA